MDQARYQRLAEWPLASAALVFLLAYGIQVIANLRGPAAVATDWVMNIVWVIFILDYIVNLVLARPRWRWFYTHLLDLAVVALPILRPLRLLRLVVLLKVLQRTAGRAFRGRIVAYAVGASLLLVVVAALAMLDVERNAPGSLITTFPQGLWWAVVTITTVGYGDLYPVTDPGRFIATGVMVSGIALLGVITATIASWIVERVSQKEEAEQAATRRQMAELIDEVRQLRMGAAGEANPPTR